MQTPLPVVKSTASDQKASHWQRWFDLDMDFYVGALPASVALLALSILSLQAKKTGDTDSKLHVGASLNLYQAEVAASTLLLAGTLVSIFLVKRRHHTFSRDSDVTKRISIARFIRASQEQRECAIETGRSQSDGVKSENQQLHHSGTSRTDIYPAYRRSESDENQCAFWHSVPTLLLVQGDFIALQVGDVAPAKCRLVDAGGGTVKTKAPCVLEAGERISLATFGKARHSPLTRFPRGKSTVQPESRELLALCNEMSVFVLEETPLEDFLRLPHGKKCFGLLRPFGTSLMCPMLLPLANQSLPQVHRQLRALRQVMFLFALIIFVVTFAVIFVRPDITSTDLSLILHVPFLAALAVLPVISPSCLFFLEVIGTARILVKIHPHVNLRSPQNTKEHPGWLFSRYLFATTSSRLSLQEPSRRMRLCIRSILRLRNDSRTDGNDRAPDFGVLAPELLRVPPASTFLLEKLGVATAFTLARKLYG